MGRIVRPGTEADLDALLELARLSGPGLTSLPECADTLGNRLALSAASFAGAVPAAEAWYTLMLEESDTGQVIGVASVRGAIGVARPHFSFRVVKLAQHSNAAGVNFEHEALVLVNECAGASEVGSLFVHPEHRGGGNGTLLAASRYMLIAAARDRFADKIVSELRGWFDWEGESPFWEGVSAKFFRLPFEEADRMITASNGQFLVDLAPRHPIYLELIEPFARDVIGEVHPDGRAARKMLESEGFSWTGLVDVFDGGPTVTCARDKIDTIRRTTPCTVAVNDNVAAAPSRLVANNAIERFRVTHAPVDICDGNAHIPASTARMLGLDAGSQILVRA